MPGPPTSPEKFHYTERTKSSVTIEWRPPRNDGGSPIIGYIIEKKRQDQPAFQRVNPELVTAQILTIEDLDELHMYEFRAKAVNALGESEPSITMTVVIQDDEGLSCSSLTSLFFTGFYDVSVSTDISSVF